MKLTVCEIAYVIVMFHIALRMNFQLLSSLCIVFSTCFLLGYAGYAGQLSVSLCLPKYRQWCRGCCAYFWSTFWLIWPQWNLFSRQHGVSRIKHKKHFSINSCLIDWILKHIGNTLNKYYKAHTTHHQPAYVIAKWWMNPKIEVCHE